MAWWIRLHARVSIILVPMVVVVLRMLSSFTSTTDLLQPPSHPRHLDSRQCDHKIRETEMNKYFSREQHGSCVDIGSGRDVIFVLIMVDEKKALHLEARGKLNINFLERIA